MVYTGGDIDILCKERLMGLANKRSLVDCYPISSNIVIMGDKRLISFCNNDYLNLSENNYVRNVAAGAIKEFGLGSCSSRLVSGNNFLYSLLEERLASLNFTDSALVFGCGFSANYSTVSTLLSSHDLLVADRYIHASVIEGCKSSKMIRFEHNSVLACEEVLKKNRPEYKNCMIFVESVYSMDGDRAPLAEFRELSKKYDCWLAVDHAHSLERSYDYDADIKIGTLSKMLGVYGGYVCSSRSVIDLLINKAKMLIYSTALPSALIAGALAALEVVESSDMLGYPLRMANLFCNELGIGEAQSQIVPLLFRSSDDAIDASKILEDNGFFVTAIRPPTVMIPRIRFAFTAAHTEEQIAALCKVVSGLNFIKGSSIYSLSQ